MTIINEVALICRDTDPASLLLAERLHQVADPMLCHYGVVEEKLRVCIDLVLDFKRVRHQRVPVVKSVELRRNAVLILELLAEEEFRVERQLEVVATQVLNVLLNDDFDGLT